MDSDQQTENSDIRYRFPAIHRSARLFVSHPLPPVRRPGEFLFFPVTSNGPDHLAAPFAPFPQQLGVASLLPTREVAVLWQPDTAVPLAPPVQLPHAQARTVAVLLGSNLRADS